MAKTQKKPTRQPSLKAATTTNLLKELDRRRGVLEEEREALLAEIEEIDAHLEDISTALPASRAPRKSRRKASTKRSGGKRVLLADALQSKLAGKQLSVTEIADSLLKSGYKTKSSAKNFRVMVNQTLTKDTRFKRVSRGIYTSA